MSTDFSIRCLDCEETMPWPVSGHGFRSTVGLVRHARAIAALAPLVEDGVELRAGAYGAINVEWFVGHAGHKLRPVSEYGAIEYTLPPEDGEQGETMHAKLAYTNDLNEGKPAGGSVSGTGIQISWQDSPLGHGAERKEPTGAFVEGVIEAAIQRLQFYQTHFPCRENAIALTHLETALLWLDKRSADREARGVEGTYAK